VQLAETTRGKACHGIQRVICAHATRACIGIGYLGGEDLNRAHDLPFRVPKALTPHIDQDAVSVLVVQLYVGLAGSSVLHDCDQRAPVQTQLLTGVIDVAQDAL